MIIVPHNSSQECIEGKYIIVILFWVIELFDFSRCDNMKLVIVVLSVVLYYALAEQAYYTQGDSPSSTVVPCEPAKPGYYRDVTGDNGKICYYRRCFDNSEDCTKSGSCFVAPCGCKKPVDCNCPNCPTFDNCTTPS